MRRITITVEDVETGKGRREVYHNVEDIVTNREAEVKEPSSYPVTGLFPITRVLAVDVKLSFRAVPSEGGEIYIVESLP